MVDIFKRFINNNRYFWGVLVLILMISVVTIKKIPDFGLMCGYIFIILFYVKLVNDSISWANSIIKQVLWLIGAPIFIALLPFLIIERVSPGIIYNGYIFGPLYLLFFVLAGVIAVFLFELNKVKIAMQLVNGIFLTIISLTFFFYFQTEALLNLIDSNLVQEIIESNISIESIFDIIVKLLTIPYVLLGIWGNIAVTIRENRLS